MTLFLSLPNSRRVPGQWLPAALKDDVDDDLLMSLLPFTRRVLQ